MSSLIPVPSNGMYYTPRDFETFNNLFDTLYSGVNATAKLCDAACQGCNHTEELYTKNVTFVVTENCNLDCTYCYEQHKTKNRMTKEIGKDGVDFLFDQERLAGYFTKEKSQAIILDFIGGEPLLEIELIDYIVEYFKLKAFEQRHPWAWNYMISISSNGVLFNTAAVQKFLAKNPGKVSITISIDGNEELHDACRVFHNGKGSYKIVEKSARKLLELNPLANTKMTLAPENIMYLNAAIKNLWHNIGYTHVNTNCVYEEGWTMEHAQIMYDQMIELADYMLDNDLHDKKSVSLFDEAIGKPLVEDRNWCGGNGQMLAIGTDGRVFSCLRFMKYALVNQKEQPIGDIWNGLSGIKTNEWFQKLSSIRMSTQSDDKCKSCEIAQGCGICTAYNYDKFGDPNVRATFICDTHHARVCASAYYFNKLYAKLGVDQQFILNCENVFAKG